MSTSPSPPGYVGQTYTVEYTVFGSLDGSTLGPALIVPSNDNEDPQQIYRPNVPGDLGLIDVDYVVETEGDERLGATGPRLVHVVWIDSPVVGGAAAALQIVDDVDGSPAIQTVVDPLVGLSQFYRNTPFLVPQGSMLRLVDFTNPGPSAIKIRLTIQYVDDLITAQQIVCACATGTAGTTSPPSTFVQESIATENVVGVDATLAAGLTSPPISIASVGLYLNGLLLRQGAGFDYVLSGGTFQNINWLAGTGTAPNLADTDLLIARYNA